MEALKRGNLIEAMKVIRDAKGVGLVEAKGIMEEVVRKLPADPRFAHHHATLTSAHASLGLAPGEVARGDGTNKWLVLFAIAGAAILLGLYA